MTSKATSEETTILVIDDIAAIRRLLSLVLRSSGQVIQAAYADAGIQCLKAKVPDVILLDVDMPGKNGLQALQEIRGISSTVPVILMTGSGRTYLVDEARALGVERIVSKPFKIEEMRDYVKATLKRGGGKK